jgi:hypothetical protein
MVESSLNRQFHFRGSAVKIIRFALFLVMALLVGTMFGIWVGFNP